MYIIETSSDKVDSIYEEVLYEWKVDPKKKKGEWTD